MKLAEFLTQGHQLRQQDRTSAIAYFEQCLQNTSMGDSSDEDLPTTVRMLLDLAAELIATKQPEALQRAKDLVNRAGSKLNQNSENFHLETIDEQKAYFLYVSAILALEMGEINDILPTLERAYQGYSDNWEGRALTDDALGLYFLKIADYNAALMSFEKSLSLRLESEDECAIAKSYAYLGQLYLLIDDVHQAASLFHNTLDIALIHSHNYLRIQALKGLAKVAIAQSQWQEAIALVKDAIALLKEPVDTIEIGYLYCDLAEALLGDRQVEASLICIRIDVLPRFRDFQYAKGIAIAKHIRGRIYVHRLLEGLDSLDEDAIETAEDSLLDASISFEQFGMMLEYAKSLYDLACLYQLCNSTQFQYQYQGKSLRSLELSLSVLDQIGMSNTTLASKVESMLNQAMRGSF